MDLPSQHRGHHKLISSHLPMSCHRVLCSQLCHHRRAMIRKHAARLETAVPAAKTADPEAQVDPPTSF
jgi:hypothetical protein